MTPIYFIFIIFLIVKSMIKESLRIQKSLDGSDDYRNNFTDYIRLKLRRYKSFKACKAFLTKEKGYYKLRNKNLVLIYDYRHKIIKCYESSNRKRITTLNWYEQYSMETFYADNLFEETFDDICYAFDENTTYDKVAAEMQYYFKTKEIETRKGTKVESFTTPYLSDESLDINTATEDEIRALPGINVILAKKIIEYRDLHCGFESVEEFYKEMNIKPHFQKQLNNLICMKEYKIKSYNEQQNERIIDL